MVMADTRKARIGSMMNVLDGMHYKVTLWNNDDQH